MLSMAYPEKPSGDIAIEMVCVSPNFMSGEVMLNDVSYLFTLRTALTLSALK